MSKVLVTGMSGLLGSNTVKLFKGGNEVVGTYHSEKVELGVKSFGMDLRKGEEIEEVLKETKPDVLVHCAAYTDVDGCETKKNLAREVNVEGTKRLAEKAEEINSKFVYISTDYVFPGNRGNYREGDARNPVNYYGETKLRGEKAITKLDDYLICRTSVLFGLEPLNKLNFATWILKELRDGKEIGLIDDQYVTPTLATDVSGAIKFLLEKDKSDVFHLAGRDCTNRYNFGLKLAKIFNLNEDLISRSKMKDMGWKAERPVNSCLSTDKIEEEGYKMMGVEESLKKMKKQEREGWF